MRELVSIQIGKCGNQIGSKFWEVISNEHGIQPDGSYKGDNEACQLENIGTYYSEAEILTDCDPDGLNFLSDEKYGKFFEEQNLITGRSSCGNVWAKGYYTYGAELEEKVLNSIRREVEKCDSFYGFQLTHSIGGGTGSGLGVLLISKIRDEFSGKNMSSFTVIPTTKLPDSVVEPYNAILTLHHLADKVDQTYCIDNEALVDICRKTENIQCTTDEHLNIIVAQTMSGITSNIRFKENSSEELYSFPSTPSPQLHFYTLGVAPLVTKDYSPFPAYSASDLTKQLFDSKTLLSTADPNNGKCFGASVMFRGNLSEQDVAGSIASVIDETSKNFVKWVPKNTKTAIRSIPQKGAPTSATLVANSTSIQQVFERLADVFDMMLSRKAFTHWYTSNGMEETEFVESWEKLDRFIFEYKQRSE